MARISRKHGILPGFGLSLGYTLFYLGLVVLIPLSTIFLKAAGMKWERFWEVVTSPRVLASYRISFGAAAAAAVINAVLGLLVAWVLVRYRFPGRRILDALIDLPFALPTAVAGIALTAVYSGNGWIGRWLEAAGVKVAFTPLGVVIALVFVGLPFVVRTVQPVLEGLSPEFEEASASLGAGRGATFRRVILPELWPAVLSGFALAFARGIGEYGSVVFISGNMPMKTEIAPLLIITQLEQYDYPAATAIAVVMLVISFGLLLIIQLLQRRSGISWQWHDKDNANPMTTATTALHQTQAFGRATTEPSVVRWVLIALAVAFLGLFLLVPLVAVFAQAFEKGAGVYMASLTDPDALSAIRLTLLTAAITVPLNVVFGLAAAWAVSKFRFPLKGTLATMIDLPFAVSPVIAGLIFVLMFGLQGWLGPWLVAHDLKIIFAVPGIVLATLFVTVPFVAREIIPLMQSLGSEEEQAALVLGAGGWRTFFRITLPNIKWGLLYGVILCNARAMGEFGAVSVVSGHIRGATNTMPLHVEILYNEYNFAGAFAVASLLALLALATLGAKTVVEWRSRRERAAEESAREVAA